ncbi:MAG: hypothetical protein ACI9JM_001639 [Halioglobus sp.]|jgi:hypothetical protein
MRWVQGVSIALHNAGGEIQGLDECIFGSGVESLCILSQKWINGFSA